MEKPVSSWTCLDCGKSFKDNAHLVSHKNRKTPCMVREVIPEDINNPNRCTNCNRILSKKEHLTRHLKTCKIKAIEPVIPSTAELMKQIEELDMVIMEKDREISKLKSIINGSIYFIVEEPFDNKVKIGMAKNPAKRLKQLQTGNPSKLVLYHVIESADYKVLERTMHDICKDLRAHGEWFEMNQSELDSILGFTV